jgi:hypothetical protein
MKHRTAATIQQPRETAELPSNYLLENERKAHD